MKQRHRRAPRYTRMWRGVASIQWRQRAYNARVRQLVDRVKTA